MPNPVAFLNSVGELLVNEGCIQSYDSPNGTTLTILVNQDVT